MGTGNLRWRQRLESLGRAVIKAYEFSFELGWKTLKDLLTYEGIDAPLPRQVIREAFAPALRALSQELEQRP